MSVRSFGSLFMVGGVAAAALSCYLVSLRVASERAALENVETEIVLAQRDIRLLQTEIGTRGRLAQLERWNVKVLLLSAPSADQFIPDGFQLARLVTPERKPAVEAPVVYASAPAPERLALPQQSSPAPQQLMHEAGLKLPPPAASSKKAASVAASSKKAAPAPTSSKKAAPAPASSSKKAAPAQTTAAKPPHSKPAPVKLAKADPLAPLPTAKKRSAAAPRTTATPTSKDSGKTR